MTPIVQVDFTIFRFVAMIFFFLVSFAGIFITVGRLLNKQKVQCKDLKIINGALWKDGRPLLQSVKVCKEERDELRDELKVLCEEIVDKLNKMDNKQDETNKLQNKQAQKIALHMQRIDLWYKEKHKG